VNPFRLPNRLFLYSYKGLFEQPEDPDGLSMAAVATISPGFFQFEDSFPFGDWSTVASAANGKKKWLFLHNRDDGSAQTGSVDNRYRYQITKNCPPGTFSDWPYHFTVVNGLGYLLLIGNNPGGGVAVGLGEVLDDGTFVEWWRTVLNIPGPDNNTNSVVGLPKAHAWFSSSPLVNQQPAGGSTIIFDVKHAQVLSTRRSEVVWEGIATEGDLLYLFSFSEKKSEICVLNDNQQLVPVKATGLDPDLVKNPDQIVASTPGAHLGYTFPSRGSEAHVRVLSRSGFPATYRIDDMGRVWEYIVRC
jgi:hypothetical protein